MSERQHRDSAADGSGRWRPPELADGVPVANGSAWEGFETMYPSGAEEEIPFSPRFQPPEKSPATQGHPPAPPPAGAAEPDVPPIEAADSEPLTTELAGETEAVTPAPTEEQLADVRQDAFEQGFREGLEAGRATAADEARSMAGELRGLLQALSEPLQMRDQQLEAALVEFCLALTERLAERHLMEDADAMAALIRRAAALLPESTERVRVFVHPVQLSRLEGLLESGPADDWELAADPELGGADCRVERGESLVDGSLRERMATLAAAVVADQEDA